MGRFEKNEIKAIANDAVDEVMLDSSLVDKYIAKKDDSTDLCDDGGHFCAISQSAD